MVSKKTLLIAAAAGLGALGVYALVMKLRGNKETDLDEAGLEEKRLQAIEKIRASYSSALATNEEEFVVLEPPEEFKRVFPEDAKPDLSSYLGDSDTEPQAEKEEPVHENVFDKEEPPTEEVLDQIGKTKYGTDKIKISENFTAIFTDEEWDSEVDSIELISQEEYNGEDWPSYDREQAVWYPYDGVLATGTFEPVNVVETVGPTAFVTMRKHPGCAVYVKNDSLEKCYELWENDVPFEEALAASGYELNLRLE